MTRRSLIASLLVAAICTPFHLAAQNQCALFTNGVDGYAEIPYHPSLVPSTGITVEAWITYDDAAIPAGTAWLWPTIVRQDPTPNRAGYFLRIEAGRTANRILNWWVATANSGNVQVQWAFAAGALLNWTHVAATYDGSMARIFVNGTQVAATPATGRIVDRGGALRIGKGDDSGGPVEVWQGEIDEVRLWPFARSGAQITASMQQELGGIPAGASSWNFNGNLVDTSGTNHAISNGTFSYPTSSLLLTSIPVAGASESGIGSLNCTGAALRAGVASVPQRGNAAFAVVCTNAPVGGTGIAQFAHSVLAQPLPLLGIDLWLNPATFYLALPVGSSSLGVAEVPLAIPNTPIVVLASTAVQFLWLDPCGPQGLTASSALRVLVLP